MILATFFRFNRFFSIRNFDIIGLIALTPGLLSFRWGGHKPVFWIYAVGLVFFFRLFADLFMVRRPLLEPNLSMSAIIFAITMLVMFLCRTF